MNNKQLQAGYVPPELDGFGHAYTWQYSEDGLKVSIHMYLDEEASAKYVGTVHRVYGSVNFELSGEDASAVHQEIINERNPAEVYHFHKLMEHAAKGYIYS